MNFIGVLSFLLGISAVLGQSLNGTVSESEASSRNVKLSSSAIAVYINAPNTSQTSTDGNVKSLDQEFREAVGVIKDKIATNKGSDGVLDSGPILVAERKSAATASNQQNTATAADVSKTSQPSKSDNNKIQATRDIIKYRSGDTLNNAGLATNETSADNTSSNDSVTDAALVKKPGTDITETVSADQSKPASGLTLSTQTRTENTSNTTRNETVDSANKQGRPADNLSNGNISTIENQDRNNTTITAADTNIANTLTVASAEITSPSSLTSGSTSSNLAPTMSAVSANSSTENVNAESAGLSTESPTDSTVTFSEPVTLSTSGSTNNLSGSVVSSGSTNNLSGSVVSSRSTSNLSESVVSSGSTNSTSESTMLSTALSVISSSESAKLSTMASVDRTSGSVVLSADAPVNSTSESVTTVRQSCTSPTCDNACRLGYMVDQNGCLTCECKVHQCQSGRLLTGTSALMCDLATSLCPLGQVCEGTGSGSAGVCCESVFTFSENCPRARPGSRLLCLVQQRYQCSSDAECGSGRSCCPSTCGNSCRRLSRRRSRLLNIIPTLNRL